MSERVDALAGALHAEGVRGIFGVPGSGMSWRLITALGERGVPFWGATHEGAGAIMAGAFGRQTGTLGCSISIKGPGLANMFPGIVSNHYESWPALSIAEAFGPAAPPERMHKRLEQAAVLAPVVKAYATLGAPADTVGRLARDARSGIPGPVHLDLYAEEGASYHAPGTGKSDPESTGGAQEIERRVARAERPVVIVGSAFRGSGWGERLADLRVPVFTTVAAKGLLDERHPYAAGVFTGDGKAFTPESRVLPAADLVVGLGLRNLEVLSPRPFAASCVLLDVVGGSSGEGFGAESRVVDGTLRTVAGVLEALSGKEWGGELVEKSTRFVRERLLGHEWLPGPVFAALEELLPAERMLVLDTGSFCTVGEHVWRARTEAEVMLSANGRYMGTGLPMALGAALADRGRPVVCATGDGGVRMYVAEIKLAIEHRLPLLVVLMTDGRYGSIVAGGAPGLRLDAVTIPRPSWFAAVEALGCPAARVADLGELDAQVRAWRWSEGPLFLEAAFDPEAYLRMTEGVR